MNIFNFMMSTRKPVIQFDLELLNTAIRSSHGSPEMSAEDIKVAILALNGVLRQQQELIEKLYEVLSAIEIDENAPFWKKLFKK